MSERVSTFIGNPSFIVVHAFWFAIWVMVNTGILALSRIFDAYPFSLLGIIIAIEAIFIDRWLNLPNKRFAANTPAEHFYENAIRFDELFADLVLPLRDEQSIYRVADSVEETATQYTSTILSMSV